MSLQPPILSAKSVHNTDAPEFARRQE